MDTNKLMSIQTKPYTYAHNIAAVNKLPVNNSTSMQLFERHRYMSINT